jgi:hypothetical protein
LEGRSAIVLPGHLEDSIGALDSLDTEALPELSCLQVLDELPYGGFEAFPLIGG